MSAIKRACRWIWSAARHDRRFQISAGLGVLFAAINIKLLIELVDRGYNKFLVNLVLSLIMGVIWYGINLVIMKDKNAKVAKSASGSFAWWLTSFGFHQATFGCAVGLVGIPYVLVKGVQYAVSPLEFVVKYHATREFIFGSRQLRLKCRVARVRALARKKIGNV